MPRVGETPKLFGNASRRVVLSGMGALGVVGPAVIASEANGSEWPEFREWYALMLEEEAIYVARHDLTDAEQDAAIEVIWTRSKALEKAMQER